jgi:hypothetical protein
LNHQLNQEEEGRAVARPAPTPVDDSAWLERTKQLDCYKGIDLDNEWAKMAAWCEVNRKKPTRRRFINWINHIDKQIELKPGADPMGLPKQIFPKTGRDMIGVCLDRIKEIKAAKSMTRPVLRQDARELIEFLEREKSVGWEAKVTAVRANTANFASVLTDEARSEIHRLNVRIGEIKKRMTE